MFNTIAVEVSEFTCIYIITCYIYLLVLEVQVVHTQHVATNNYSSS